MEIRIKKIVSGNCKCANCGKYQEGLKGQPFTVWYRSENEKRGHNVPVCSQECANKYAATLKEVK